MLYMVGRYSEEERRLVERVAAAKQAGNKLEELQLVRKEIRDEGYQHPFFWSAFILVGEVD